LDEDGFRIVIHTDDHEPAHVHVKRDGADLRVYLDAELPAERVFGRLKAVDERRALRIVEKHRATLLAVWKHYHR
jgi:hypothetical protein